MRATALCDDPEVIFTRKGRLPQLVEFAIEEARGLGFDGETSYDADARVLTVDGLGPVTLGPFMDRAEGLTEAQQRPKMRAAITKVMRAQPPELPDRYDARRPTRGPLFARWSPAGAAMVVWGRYGTHDVHDEEGGRLLAFPAPATSNLVATIGAAVLVTAGDDGWLVVNDLVRGAAHGNLEIGAPVVRLDIDPTDRFAAATTLDDEVHVVALDALEPVPLHAPARIARWSSVGTALACCDGNDLWLEVWD